MGKLRSGLRLVACTAAIMLLVTASGCIPSASSKPYSVSGRITDAEGKGVGGIILAFGGSGIAITDEDGHWSKANLKGTVKVTPAPEGWRFEPASQSVSAASSTVDFVGTKLDYVGLHEGTEWTYLATKYDSEGSEEPGGSITVAVEDTVEEVDGTYFTISHRYLDAARALGASHILPEQIVKPLQNSEEPWLVEVRRWEGQYCLVFRGEGEDGPYMSEIMMLQEPIKQDHVILDGFGLRVEAEESVTTPAGSFKAWRCVARRSWWDASGLRLQELTLWFVPYVGIAKVQLDYYYWNDTDRQYYLTEGTTYVLEDYVPQ